VLAYPAAHYAVADADPARDYGFVYLNLRMARGRSTAVHQSVGRALEACAKAHFASLLAERYIGITLQIDEGAEVFDAKNSSIHPLFRP
jgi:5-carboxymethyl-2-hydroxymuconate isomerase